MVNVRHNKTYGDYVFWRGGNMTPIDVQIAESLPSTVRLTQGGLSGAVRASAKTHFGLGAFDVNIDGWDKEEVWNFASEGLRSGWVVFPRGFVWDTFQGKTISNINDGNEHCHVCSRESYRQLHPQAQAQIDEYLKSGGDGLIGSHGYTGPATKSERWATSPYNPQNIRKGGGTAVVQVDTLIGNSVDRYKRYVRDKGFEIVFTHQVRRWGRWNVVSDHGTYYALSDADGTYVKIVETATEPVLPTPVS